MYNHDEQIKLPEKLAFACGSMTLISMTMIMQYLMVYYTNVALLDVAIISSIMAVSRIFDGISDLIVGSIIDNTRSKHGKARVWIRRNAIPYGIALFIVFYVPGAFPEFAKYVYIFVTYNLLNTCFYTIAFVAHTSLLSLMTTDEKTIRQISSISGFVQNVSQMLLSVVIVKLLMVFTSEPGNALTQRSLSCTSAIIAVITIIIGLCEFYFTKERVIEKTESDETNIKKGIGSFLSEIKIFFTDKYWILLLILNIIATFGAVLYNTAMSYYALYNLKDFDSMAFINLVFGIGAILAGIVMIWVGPKIPGVSLLRAAYMFLAVGFFGLGLAGINKVLMTAALLVAGFGMGISPIAMQTTVVRIVNYTQKKKGKLMPGIGNAITCTGSKIGMAIASVFFGIVMSAAGFDAALDAQGIDQAESVLSTIKLLFAGIPAIIFLGICIIVIFLFDIDKKDKIND